MRGISGCRSSRRSGRARCRRRPTFVHLSMYLYLGRERSLAPHLSGAWLPYSRATQTIIATSIKTPTRYRDIDEKKRGKRLASTAVARNTETTKQRTNENFISPSPALSHTYTRAHNTSTHSRYLLGLSLSRARQLYLALQRFQPISQQQRRVSGETRCAERSRVIDRSPPSIHSRSLSLSLSKPKPNSTAITRTGEKSSTSFDLSAIACYAPYSRGGA